MREEDVVNEEMYEEEDDDLPNQFRRINALNPGFGPLSDRLNNYMAGHIGIRSALQHAIMQANQHHNNTQFMNPTMQSTGYMSSPQGMGDGAFNGIPPSPWSDGTLNIGRTGAHNRSASIATPQQSSRPLDYSPTIKEERRPSLPDNSQSPTNNADQEKEALTAGHPYGQNTPSQLAPLTTQLPMDMQQMLAGGSRTQQPNFFSNPYLSNMSMGMTGSHNHYDLLDMKPDPNAWGFQPSYNSSLYSQGLDQTLSPTSATWDSSADNLFCFSNPSSTAYKPAGFDASESFHGLDHLADSDYGFDFDHADFGSNSDPGDEDRGDSGSVTPAVLGNPTWDDNDFVDFVT